MIASASEVAGISVGRIGRAPSALFVADHLGYPGVIHGASRYFAQVLPRPKARGVRAEPCLLGAPHPFAERLLPACRWHAVLHWSGAAVPLRAVLRIGFVNWFLGPFLPGAVGVEALRVAGLARQTSSASLALSSVLVDRVLAALTLAPLVVLGLAMTPMAVGPGVHAMLGGPVGLILAGGLMLMLAAGRRALGALTPRWASPLVGARLEAFYRSLDACRSRPGWLAWSAGLALGFQFLCVAMALVAVRALGIQTPAAYLLAFVPITNLVSLMPMSLGGLGVREMGFVYFLKMAGAPGEAAFAASLLVYIAGMISILPGAWICARARGSRDGGAGPCTSS